MLAARRDGLIHPILVGPPTSSAPAGPSGRFGPGGGPGPRRNRGGVRRPGRGPDRQGRGSLLIKGRLSTGDPAGGCSRPCRRHPREGLLSHVAILEVPAYHKLLYITDGGLVVAPGLEEKRAILRNALSLCRFLGYERPKAAALCAAETVSPRMPETGDAADPPGGGSGETSALPSGGPISLDLATSAEAARLATSPVAGTRTSFSSLHRRRQSAGQGPLWAGRRKMAGVVLGASVPIALNSRGLPGRRNITPSSSAPPCPGGDPAKKEAFLMPERLLILNPGSTSTKAAVYDGTRPLFSRSIPTPIRTLPPSPPSTTS
ncbi:MAG: phosphate acyltransferase [Dysosmobacter welbionis]